MLSTRTARMQRSSPRRSLAYGTWPASVPRPAGRSSGEHGRLVLREHPLELGHARAALRAASKRGLQAGERLARRDRAADVALANVETAAHRAPPRRTRKPGQGRESRDPLELREGPG